MNYQIEFKKNYMKACNFFGIKPKNIKLKIIKNIKLINKLSSNVPWYAVGFYNKNTVIMLDKELLPSRGHKKREFSKVMLHEICHIFIKKIVKKRIPVWVEEGICQFIAFGDKIKPKKFVNLRKLQTYEDWYKLDNPYAYCSNFFSYLNKKYGKKKILKFIRLLNKRKPEDAFAEVFGQDIKVIEIEFRRWLKNLKNLKNEKSLKKNGKRKGRKGNI